MSMLISLIVAKRITVVTRRQSGIIFHSKNMSFLVSQG